MFEVAFVIVVTIAAMYICIGKRRQRREAAAQARANTRGAEAAGSLVAVNIDGNWFLFPRGEAPAGHQQASIPVQPGAASPQGPGKPAVIVAQPGGEVSVAVELTKVPPAAGDEVAPVRDVPFDPAWDASEDTGHHSAAEGLPVGHQYRQRISMCPAEGMQHGPCIS